MFANWKADPRSVHASWDAYFKTGTYQAPPTLLADYAAGAARSASPSSSASFSGAPSGDAKAVADTVKVVQLIRAFQVRGHLMADLDPLGIIKTRSKNPAEFQLAHWGFSEADLDREFDVSQADVHGFMGAERGKNKLRHIYRRLQQTYCNKIGLEYMHIADRGHCNWLRSQFETVEEPVVAKADKLQTLDRLTWADHFERFCAQKYNTAKRFGLEGCESLIPGLRAMIDTAADAGVANVVLGMPHRGRLVVLNSVVNKPLEQIFHEFSGVGQTQETEGSGDVKYHLGYSSTQAAGASGNKVHVTLVANPSHLEAENTVVCGKVRAKQFYEADKERAKTVPILLHGDAAFAGQGIVFETMGLSDLPDYTSGGTIHVVVNNQIGFTTDPTVARTSPYCSDIAKAFNAPILHVNAEDPESVVRVCKVAMEWRQKFKKDVVIDLIGYRKHGHNEIDEPDFTQPNMYAVIRQKKSLLELYTERLLTEGSVTKDEAAAISTKTKAHMEEKFQASKTYKYGNYDWLGSKWAGLTGSRTHSKIRPTGVAKEKLLNLGERLTTLPADFTPHRVVKSVYENRGKSIKNNAGLDWCVRDSGFGV
jgi:2-oxoglutarate dehydrogenase E1 component